ncbi:hypothetical protein IEQ34_017683 [Dendrobium chrysotoxum]|uniref:Uncharacterized protein n=1 Tax=Dendrobium chrysotoxum TaxID=161865 RepID=A0AAV7FUQ0_DENCH|nr:hypothetical protein IEQ34_017683 [Dendrobium chrysotoxum]
MLTKPTPQHYQCRDVKKESFCEKGLKRENYFGESDAPPYLRVLVKQWSYDSDVGDPTMMVHGLPVFSNSDGITPLVNRTGEAVRKKNAGSLYNSGQASESVTRALPLSSLSPCPSLGAEEERPSSYPTFEGLCLEGDIWMVCLFSDLFRTVH